MDEVWKRAAHLQQSISPRTPGGKGNSHIKLTGAIVRNFEIKEPLIDTRNSFCGCGYM